MGTFVSARISSMPVSDAFRVRNAAIRGADSMLFIDEGNTVSIRSVDILRTDSEFAYFRGAEVGERVITSALETPIEGMSVRTETETGDEPARLATADEDGEE